MALLSSQPVYLPTAMPPPTLTNPDLILPYRSSSLSASYSTGARTERRRGVANRDDGSLKEGMQKLFGNGVRLDRSGSDPVMPYMQSQSRDRTRLGDYQGRQKSKERLFLTPSPTSDDDYYHSYIGDFKHPKIINGHWQGFDGPYEEIAVERSHHQSQRSPEVKHARRKKSPPPVNGSQEIRAILDEDEDDPHSHAAMSKRAELILANAKKRLLVSVQPVPPRPPLKSSLTSSRRWKTTSAVPVMVSMAVHPPPCHHSQVISPLPLRSIRSWNAPIQLVRQILFLGVRTQSLPRGMANGTRGSSAKHLCLRFHRHKRAFRTWKPKTQKNQTPQVLHRGI